MLSRKCCVMNCPSKNSEERAFFVMPMEGKQRKMWLDAIGDHLYKANKYPKNLYVCDRHFEDACFAKTPINSLVDGVVQTFARKYVRLLKNSRPSLFENYQPTQNVDDVQPVEEATNSYSLSDLVDDLNNELSKLPPSWSYTTTPHGIMLLGFDEETYKNVEKSILIKYDMNFEVRVDGKMARISKMKLKSFSKVMALIEKVNNKNAYSNFIANQKLKDYLRLPPSELIAHRMEIKNLKRKLGRAVKRLVNSESIIKHLKKKCKISAEAALFQAIETLPEKQREVVRMCIKAVKCSRPNGIRYSNSWVYESLTLKLKSSNAYLHLQRNNILPLPTFSTLSKYTKCWEQIVEQLVKNARSNGSENSAGISAEHDYNVSGINELTQICVAGFVAFLLKKWTKCNLCHVTALEVNEVAEIEIMKYVEVNGKAMELMNHDVFAYPTVALITLVNNIEKAIHSVLGGDDLNCHTFHHLPNILPKTSIVVLGCPNHAQLLTKKIVMYYIINRATLLVNADNALKEPESERTSTL